MIVTSIPFIHLQQKRAVGYTNILFTVSEESELPHYNYPTYNTLQHDLQHFSTYTLPCLQSMFTTSIYLYMVLVCLWE